MSSDDRTFRIVQLGPDGVDLQKDIKATSAGRIIESVLRAMLTYQDPNITGVYIGVDGDV